MRVALAQINPTVGDIAGNARMIAQFIQRAKSEKADLCIFPELSLVGYPPKDLLLAPHFIDENLKALHSLAASVNGISVIVGYAEKNASPIGRPLHNAVA